MTPNRKRAALLGVVACAAVVVAGCSSTEDKNEYVNTVDEIQGSALESFNATASETPENKRALIEQLESGEQALAGAVEELEAVEVPDEAQDGHPELVAGIDDLRALFAQTAQEVRSANTSESFAAISDLGTEGAEIGNRIDAAIDRINADLGAD